MMDEDIFDPIAELISPAHMEQIGYLTVAFSALEATMDEAIVYFVQAEERIGDILTSRLSFEARLDLIQSLADETIQELDLKSQFDYLVARIKKVQKERNQLVHARWQTTRDANIAVVKKIRAKQKLDIQFASYTAEQIKNIAEEVDYVMRDLSLWIINEQINRSMGL